jgi:hypothetical protein
MEWLRVKYALNYLLAFQMVLDADCFWLAFSSAYHHN